MKYFIKIHYKFIVLIILAFLIFNFIPNLDLMHYNEDKFESSSFTNELLCSSIKSNYNIIEDLFKDKIEQYSENNYYNQYYTPSLQGMFYALYILDVIGKLNSANHTSMVSYIINQYDEDLQFFMGDYSYHYLDTDFNLKYYSLNSVLEVNCYAVLSLNILNRTDLINSEKFIDFIWSCFNPNKGGFIEQPFNHDIHPFFKLPTLDNTYFAILTLDLLNNDWSLNRGEKNNITNFVNSLQSDMSSDIFFGGFLNDNNDNFNSLNCFEPNLLSSFYAIKILDIFGLKETIDMNNFYSYLGFLYDSNENYFNFAGLLPSNNYSNLIASSLGLDLSIITNYLNISKQEIITFLLENQNGIGLWSHTTETETLQLIDTFQIIRSLKESGNIDILNESNKNKISEALSLFTSNHGYSITPHTFTLQSTLNTVIRSFYLHDRISELEIQDLYSKIEKSYYDSDNDPSRGFYACINLDRAYSDFRCLPIEFHNFGNHIFTSKIDYPNAQKHTYLALDSLRNIFKMDDFSRRHNLTELLHSILNCQYMDENSPYYGGFIPFEGLNQLNTTNKEKFIFLENSYYTIKCLELLSQILGLNSITNMSFNKEALFNYLQSNVKETDSEVYFQPSYSSDIELALKNTYFMIYILQTLNLYDLNTLKIKNFISNHLNYENIINIYYSYKISELLKLNFPFDSEKIYELVKLLFVEDIKEFKVSKDFNVINQEIVLWIVEMAKFSPLEIDFDYQEMIKLGSVNTIRLKFQNMILKEFGDYVIIIYENEQLGTLYFEEQYDKSYQVSFYIPEEPQYFPSIDGKVKIYINGVLTKELNIEIQTELDQVIIEKINKVNTEICFEYNISRLTNSEYLALGNSSLKTEIYYQNNLIDIVNFEEEVFINHTYYFLEYNCSFEGLFEFKIVLTDDFYPYGLDLSIIPFEVEFQNTELNNNLIFTGPLLAVLCLMLSSAILIISINSGKYLKNKFWVKNPKVNPHIVKEEEDYNTIDNKLKSYVKKLFKD